MFKPENYTPENSVENFLLNESIHGKMIALIHQVSGEDESTLLFFSDQAIHHSNGFHLQDKNGKAALQSIVATIYGGWTYPDALEVIAENPRKTTKNLHFCFGPVGFFEEKSKEINLGFHVYLQYLKKIYIEELGESIIMNEAIS